MNSVNVTELRQHLPAYLERVRSAAKDLIRRRYMLEEDLDRVVERAGRHWDFATHVQAPVAR